MPTPLIFDTRASSVVIEPQLQQKSIVRRVDSIIDTKYYVNYHYHKILFLLQNTKSI